LAFARQRDTLGDFATALGRRRQDEVGRGHRRHLDMQVDAIEQRSGYAGLILGSAPRVGAAPAGKARLVGFAATARIHRRHQHEAGRISDAVIGTGDRDFSAFKRLA
jgi:hypothetical protein